MKPASSNIKSGIYKITNIITGKIYIESTKNIRRRFSRHRNLLIKNKYENKYLQNSVNKYGIENFKFEILEEAIVEDLLHKEQYWLDKTGSYKGSIGYNILSKASSTEGYRHSEETKNRLRNFASKLKLYSTVSNNTETGQYRLKEDELAEVLKLAEDGVKKKDICLKFGISRNTLYKLLSGKSYKYIIEKPKYIDSRRKLREDDIHAVFKMRGEGMSMSEISKHFSVNRTTIWKILKKEATKNNDNCM